MDSRQRETLVYALTSRRLLIVGGLFKKQIKSFNLNNLPPLSFTAGRSGRGTISFDGLAGLGIGSRNPWSFSVRSAFEEIADGKSVYDQIRTAQAATL